MSHFDLVVEQQIQKAIREGAFEDLPGAGKPLQFEDQDIPEESRMAYKILKNAGYLPEEMQIRKDLKGLEALLEEIPTSETERRQKILAQLNQGWARYHAVMEKRRRV